MNSMTEAELLVGGISGEPIRIEEPTIKNNTGEFGHWNCGRCGCSHYLYLTAKNCCEGGKWNSMKQKN